jgi:tetratricopeptide (TPR) repeat protein
MLSNLTKVLTGLVWVAAGVAHGAQTVLFNESAAFECYQAALHGKGSEFDIEPCTNALEHQALSPIDRAATHSNRGLLYARIGDVQEAMRDHNRAIKLAPEVGSIYVNRSNTLVRLKRFDKAMDDLEKAIELADVSLAHAHYNRALLFHRLGDRQAARMDAERAAEIAPETESYRRYLRMLRLEEEVTAAAAEDAGTSEPEQIPAR